MKRSVLWIWRSVPAGVQPVDGGRQTTVQRIYENARKKLALALVEGRPLRIGGGDYRLCDGQESCGHDECFKRTYHQQYEKKKGADTMRIAVAYENGQIFQHFGHTEQFKFMTQRAGL